LLRVSGVCRREVAVSKALLQDCVGDLPVEAVPLRLLVFLIPAQPQPAQPFEYRLHGSLGIALDIGIVEAEDHDTATALGIKPVEDEGASAPYVQKTGGRGRKSDSGTGGWRLAPPADNGSVHGW